MQQKLRAAWQNRTARDDPIDGKTWKKWCFLFQESKNPRLWVEVKKYEYPIPLQKVNGLV